MEFDFIRVSPFLRKLPPTTGYSKQFLCHTRIERSGEDELVVDSWCRVVGGSEMRHVINSEGEVKGGFVEHHGY